MIEINFVKSFVEKSIRENWNHPALSDYQGKTLTYKQVAGEIHRIHRILDIYGVQPGDKIALVGRNNSNWAIVYLATITYRAVIVPILADFSPTDIHHIVNHSDSVLLFAGEMVWEGLDAKAMPNLKAIFSVNTFGELVSRDHAAAQRFAENDPITQSEIDALTPQKICYPENSNANLGVISYTSGTTGFSKGVMLSLNSLAANVDFGRNNIGIRPKDDIVSFLPLAHAYGCVFEFLMPFSVGCHVTFLTKVPSPKIILQAFREIRPRLVLAVPLIIEKIYKKQILPAIDKKSMKVLMAIPGVNRLIFNKINKKLTDVFGGNFLEIVIGGAALNPEVEAFLRKIGFRYTVGYGMTECGPLISYSGWRTNPQASCGQVLPTLEVKIDSKDPYTEPGEILIRGENVMEGYYKNPEATSKALVEGWLHSGDLGVFDRNGFLYIKGRSKSMILGASGQNIYPEEIEARLNNLPFIQESIVVQQSSRLIGLVYPDYEAADLAGHTEKELELVMEQHRIEVNKHLPQYCQIAKIQLHPEEFAKTPKKSIKRFLYQVGEN